MMETLILITLPLLFLIYFRPGKTPPLDNPLVINRTGRHQSTLSPQLNLAHWHNLNLTPKINTALLPWIQTGASPRYWRLGRNRTTT